MASFCRLSTNLMTARQKYDDGVRVAVDHDVIAIVDQSMPKGLTRTSWINLLIQIGVANATFLDEAKAVRTEAASLQQR